MNLLPRIHDLLPSKRTDWFHRRVDPHAEFEVCWCLRCDWMCLAKTRVDPESGQNCGNSNSRCSWPEPLALQCKTSIICKEHACHLGCVVPNAPWDYICQRSKLRKLWHSKRIKLFMSHRFWWSHLFIDCLWWNNLSRIRSSPRISFFRLC